MILEKERHRNNSSKSKNIGIVCPVIEVGSLSDKLSPPQ
jgi:hypothetical protein